MPTVKQRMMIAEVTLLEIGGVDNWEWYSESLENYGYVKSEDEYEDAENFLAALEQGGVDNWTWYDESRTGLWEYEEYLKALPDLDDAVDVYSWKEEQEALAKAAQVAAEAEAKVIAQTAAEEAATQKRQPAGVADGLLFEHIVAKFGADRAEDVFDLAYKNGLWKMNTFPKDYKVAIKEFASGAASPFEAARVKLISLVIKNGKLDVFLNEIVEE